MFTVLNTFFLSPRRFFVSFSVEKKPLLTVGLWFTKREKETGSMTTSSELNWNLLNYLYIVDVDGRTRLSAAQKCHLLHWICVDCARQSQAVPVYAMRSVNTYIRRFFLTSFGTFAKYFRTKIVLNTNYGYMVSSIGCPSHTFESAFGGSMWFSSPKRKCGTFDETDRS